MSIENYLRKPPTVLLELLDKHQLQLTDGKRYEFRVWGNDVIISEIGLISGTGVPDVDVLSFGTVFRNPDPISRIEVSRNGQPVRDARVRPSRDRGEPDA